MESPSKHHLSPTKTPLFPASPERINQQKLAASFSVPSDLSQKASDVREKIAFLNNLSRAGSPAASPQNVSSTMSSGTAALQRAILGREEAESALSSANAMLSEAQARERRISERLESLLEELQTTRERQAHERAVFEKEVRKARKEAFRAGSMLVKAQEELKLSKGEIKNLRDEVRAERESKERAKQEAFERAYALAGMSEEVQSLKDQLRATESNNQQSMLESHVDELEQSVNKPAYTDQATCTTPTTRRPKRSADALELLQIAQGTERNAHREETPTKKMRLSRRVSNKENLQPANLEDQGDLIADLQAEIKSEQRRREKAEDMVLFMKMECQFKRCSCRIAESLGQKYVHDNEWDETMQEENLHIEEHVEEHIEEHLEEEEEQEQEQEQNARESTPATSAHSPLVSPVSAMTPPTPHYQESTEPEKAVRPARQSSVAFDEETGTFVQVSSPHAYMHDRPSEGPLVLPNADDDDDDVEDEVEDDAEVPHGSPAVRVMEMQMQIQTEDVVSHQPYELAVEEQEEPIAAEPRLENNHPSEAPAEVITSIIRNPILPPYRSSERLPITPMDQITVIKEETITKTVPIQFESKHARNPMDIIPGTPLTREEALAQIRARRGRTQSSTQRSVSANEATTRGGGAGGMKGGPVRRIPGVKHSDTRSEADVKDRRSAPVSRRY
jgi:hypothetical protein